MNEKKSSKFREAVSKKIDDIETEMKRLSMWQDENLPSDKYEFSEAFAADTMTFNQWLQFILIPRVREILVTGGGFPENSMVGVRAFREFDGYAEADDLVTMLQEFDALINKGENRS